MMRGKVTTLRRRLLYAIANVSSIVAVLAGSGMAEASSSALRSTSDSGSAQVCTFNCGLQ